MAESQEPKRSMLSYLVHWVLGCIVLGLGVSLLASTVIVADRFGASWSVGEIFLYTGLAFVGLGILLPFGFLVLLWQAAVTDY